jgi:hypothetical protein
MTYAVAAIVALHGLVHVLGFISALADRRWHIPDVADPARGP